MLLTDKILIKIGARSFNHFKDLGYNVATKKELLVDTKHLQNGCKIKVLVKCDICGFEKLLPYVDYIRNLKYNLYTCSEKCSQSKKEKTCMLNYGVNSPAKSQSIKDKKIENNFIKYGVSSPNQNKEIHEKQQISGFKMKTHISGLKYRGTYELDFINFCCDNKIIITSGDTIKYFFKNIEKIYFPDFFIPHLNLIIEVKSKYYYRKYLDKNLSKQKECIKNGYNYLFLIDKDYGKLKELL